MKTSRKILLCIFAFVGLAAGIALVILKLSPRGPSPLAYKVLRYQTNDVEIVAFVQMQNVSSRVIQYECQPGTMRLRCEYSDGQTKRRDPPSGVSRFIHPGDAVVGEIPLRAVKPVFVGIMMRELIPPRRNAGFFVALEVRIRSMFGYKPCYLPEPLLPPTAAAPAPSS